MRILGSSNPYLRPKRKKRPKRRRCIQPSIYCLAQVLVQRPTPPQHLAMLNQLLQRSSTQQSFLHDLLKTFELLIKLCLDAPLRLVNLVRALLLLLLEPCLHLRELRLDFPLDVRIDLRLHLGDLGLDLALTARNHLVELHDVENARLVRRAHLHDPLEEYGESQLLLRTARLVRLEQKLGHRLEVIRIHVQTDKSFTCVFIDHEGIELPAANQSIALIVKFLKNLEERLLHVVHEDLLLGLLRDGRHDLAEHADEHVQDGEHGQEDVEQKEESTSRVCCGDVDEDK